MTDFGPFSPLMTTPITLSWKAQPLPSVPAWPATTMLIECCGEPHRVVLGSDGTISTPDHREEHDVLWAIGVRQEQERLPGCQWGKKRVLLHCDETADWATGSGFRMETNGHMHFRDDGGTWEDTAFHDDLERVARTIAHIRLANLRFRRSEVPEVVMSIAGRQAKREATALAKSIGCVAIAMSSHTCESDVSKLQTVVMLADPDGNCTGRAAVHAPPDSSPRGPIISHFGTGDAPNRVRTDPGDFAKAAFMNRRDRWSGDVAACGLISHALVGGLRSLASLAELWRAQYLGDNPALARFNDQRFALARPPAPTEVP
jgi:hypothetical protein